MVGDSSNLKEIGEAQEDLSTKGTVSTIEYLDMIGREVILVVSSIVESLPLHGLNHPGFITICQHYKLSKIARVTMKEKQFFQEFLVSLFQRTYRHQLWKHY